MISANIVGGLGNQLFIIFNALAQSIRTCRPVVFLKMNYLSGEGIYARFSYWNTFLCALEPYLVKEFPTDMQQYIMRESGFHYTPIYLPEYESKAESKSKANNNMHIFDGYFQSYKYFDQEYPKIINMIGLEEKQEQYTKKWFMKNGLIPENTVSMHFRLGDYKAKPEFHPIMPYEYYEKSLEYISENTKITHSNLTHILYFCELEDLEIVNTHVSKLKQKFPHYIFNSIISNYPKLQDYDELIVMSICAHNIIANSSFSWWGAYFNRNPGKLVCYPSVWFGPHYPVYTGDICPPSWKKIEI